MGRARAAQTTAPTTAQTAAQATTKARVPRLEQRDRRAGGAPIVAPGKPRLSALSRAMSAPGGLVGAQAATIVRIPGASSSSALSAAIAISPSLTGRVRHLRNRRTVRGFIRELRTRDGR